jgi:hypothetical protein
MHLINIPQMQGVVEHVVIGENEPAWFHGEPGCGKSEGIGGACKALDAQLIDFRLGQYDTVDFKGFPDIDRETNTTVWHMASTLPFVGNPKFDPERKKVVFLDEADHGKDSVKGVAYQLLQERRVGEHIIMPNTFFAAAGNRPKDRGVGGKSPPPLNNRCTHYEVGPDADVWVQWAGTQSRIPSELMAFMLFRKPLISTFDPKSPDPAFATPRSWTKVAHYDTNPRMPEDIKDASIEGAVGEGPAAEYAGFKKVIKDMPSMKDIEDNPTTVSVSDKPEVRWAVAVGIAGELAQRPTSSGAYQQYLDRMDPEFGILAWQLGLKRNEALIGTKEFLHISRVHQAIFASVNRG